jgi:hypothetical protein
MKKLVAAFFPIALGAMILVPGADAREEGPIEIEKCQTISQPGSYKLVNNLTFSASSGTCLQITASFVTVDLAGFSISGNGSEGPSNQSTAIDAGSGVNGIAVRNGSISGFGNGVSLDGAGSSIEGLRVGAMGLPATGIAAAGIIKNNNVIGVPGGEGISATGIVSGNYVSSSRLGMVIGQGSTVIGNTVTGSGSAIHPGLSVECPSNVTNNTAVNNSGQNLVLNGDGCNNTNNVAP